ncbi:MAG: glycosyltransferase family 2 protein [Parcubacteria group bacterium]|jgi:GT2 family glycosyltransferase
MDLSIIITTRNRKSELLSCIKSINASQHDIGTWEIIVVDDNSNDGTEKFELADLEVANGKIIHNSVQQMTARARNMGYEKSSGRFILFIDDDNILDREMIRVLFDFALTNSVYGIVGPTMYYLKTKQKYLDFQKINLFTGKTSGMIDETNHAVCESDGVPNAFLIKREVFENCGLFDEELIQTFAESDFAFRAGRYGYKCGMLKKAKIYHNVTLADNKTARALGGKFKQKAYCLMRNRTVIIVRHGNLFQKTGYLLFFSWVWPLIYSLFMLREKRFDLVGLYWDGFFDGIRYFFTGRLVNSLKK